MSRRNWPTPGPFKLPLSAEQFTSALRKGQGRVFLHVRAHDSRHVSTAILDACVHDWSWDLLREGRRAAWLMAVADAAGLEDQLAGDVVHHLSRAPNPEIVDLKQLCALALILAQRGRTDARNALDVAFRMHFDARHLIGGRELIELDGAGGLIAVARKCGRLLRDPAAYIGDEPVRWFDDRHGQGAADRMLAEVAASNRDVRRYLKHAREKAAEGDLQGQLPKARNMAVREIIKHIKSRKKRVRGQRVHMVWGRWASEEAVREALEHVYTERLPERIEKYLEILECRALVELDPRWLQFSDHSDARVRVSAHRALAHYKDPRVRDLAMRHIRNGRLASEELWLLKVNYEVGDWELISPNLSLPEELGALHSVLMDLLKVFEHNLIAEAAEPMLLVYEHTPCALCRENAVEVLVNIEQFPDWVRQECAFDVEPDIRELAGNGQRTSGRAD